MEGAQLVQSTKTVSSTERKLHRSIWLPINPRVHQQLLQKICKVSFSALHDNDLWSKLQGCKILLLSPWWGWDDLKFSVPMQYWCNSFVLVHAAKTNKKPCVASYDQEKIKQRTKTFFFFIIAQSLWTLSRVSSSLLHLHSFIYQRDEEKGRI